MADISFLNIIPPLQLRSGMEYLEWQKTTFFDELTAVIKEAYDPKKMRLNLDRNNRFAIEQCIRKNSNIKITVQIEPGMQFAIDVGFITPGSVFNSPGIDKFFKSDYTNISKAFKELKTNVIKGYCDLTTGKVEGDYKEIPFNLYLGEDVFMIFSKKKFIEQQGVPPEQIIAGIILHEVGHAFFGLHYLSSTVIDNAMLMQSIKLLLNEPDKTRKAQVVKDIEKVLDIDVANTGIENKNNPDELIIIFEKGLANRDYRRTLSFGVTNMSVEVLADIYCSRMGGGRATSVALAVFDKRSNLTARFIHTAISITAVLLGTGIVFGAIFGAIMTLGLLASFANKLVATIYDSPYRRLKGLLRDQIAFLNSKNNNLSPLETRKIINDAKALDDLVERQKSFWEGTAAQRLIGWIFRGNDFRKTDVENYTADLVNSRLALSTL